MKWLLILLSLVIIIAISNSSVVPKMSMDENSKPSHEESSNPVETQFVSSDEPIFIQGNEGFELHGWPGSGTENDPYTLANVNLDLNSTSITILNTDAHFVIENVSLSTSDLSDYYSYPVGIYFMNVRNGTIRRTDIRDKSRGFFSEFCSGLKIENTTSHDVSTAISIENTNDFTIVNSDISRISIWNSQNINVSDSTIHSRGIYVESSRNLHVSNSLIQGDQGYYGTTGLDIQSTRDIVITETLFEEHMYAARISNSLDILVNRCQIVNSYTAFSLSNNIQCKVIDTTIDEGRIDIGASFETQLGYEFINVTVDNRPVAYFAGIKDAVLNETDYSFLFLHSVQNIELFNENGINVSLGLYIAQSKSVTIRNLFTNDMDLSDSNGTVIINSTINRYFSSWSCRDISLLNVRSSAVVIDSNQYFTIMSSQIGQVSMFSSRNVTIISTIISASDDYSLYIAYSGPTLVQDSSIFGLGIHIEGYDLLDFVHQFSNVSVNGKPLGYFVGIENRRINPDSYAQVILVDCHEIIIEDGSMSDVSDPFTFALSSNIQVSNIFLLDITGNGFTIRNSNEITLHEITIFNGQNGIDIFSSDVVSITNSSLIIEHRGVYVYDSSNVQINETSIIGGIGIEIMDSANILLSENNIATEDAGINLYDYVEAQIIGNRISAGGVGVSIYYSAYWDQDSELVDIVGNTFYQCLIGINIEYSNGVNVIGNHIIASWMNGIYLVHAHRNRITFNEIAFTDNYGMLITSDSQNNQIFGNLFHHNEVGHAAETILNSWNTTGGVGNLWDDYNGEGGYQIIGSTTSYDMYPLNITGDDYTLPLSSSPKDITINGSDAYSDLNWVVWIEHPIDYIVFADSVEIQNGTLSVSNIVSVELNQLTQGAHNLTLWITSASGESRIDQVTVIIGSIIPGELVTLAMIPIVVATVVFLEMKRRRNQL